MFLGTLLRSDVNPVVALAKLVDVEVNKLEEKLEVVAGGSTDDDAGDEPNPKELNGDDMLAPWANIVGAGVSNLKSQNIGIVNKVSQDNSWKIDENCRIVYQYN